MSRHRLRTSFLDSLGFDLTVGWDAPLDTYFVIMLGHRQTEVLISKGFFPSEIPTPEQALALVEPYIPGVSDNYDLIDALTADKELRVMDRQKTWQLEGKVECDS